VIIPRFSGTVCYLGFDAGGQLWANLCCLDEHLDRVGGVLCRVGELVGREKLAESSTVVVMRSYRFSRCSRATVRGWSST